MQPTFQLVTAGLPLAGLGAGLVLSIVAAAKSARGRDAATWIHAAWTALVLALLAGFGPASETGTVPG